MKYHFIGIGGVSMSGLARLLLDMGNEVTGCDVRKLKFENDPQAGGLKVIEGHSENHITKDLDAVIVTAAALHENSIAKSEIEKAIELKIPVIKRSEMIGKLMSQKTGIAISGMHGKTTVSTMLSLILEKAGLDPMCLIGSNVKEWGKNYRYGKGKYFVAEACEYDRQMLDFKPKIIIITNIDEEHLDTYPGGIKEIKQAFKKFIKKLPKDGLLVVWREDKNLMQLAQIARKRGNIVRDVSVKKLWPGLKLRVLGKHNLLDATFAARVAHEIGIKSKIIKDTLNKFTGAGRRFEIKGANNHVTVVDDYGHHPTEIKATIQAAKEYLLKNNSSNVGDDNLLQANKLQPNKLIMVFQSHQYTRTKLLFKDFVHAFDGVDKLIITDIYLISGREPKEARADYSKVLVEEIKKHGIDAEYVSNYDSVLNKLKETTKPGDLIVTQGATDIYKVGDNFLKK
jgi:UDP-N-acetylmuramate--alanine ligase